MVHIGIDIGTSNTVVAYLNGQGDVVAHQIDGSALVPSAVYVEEHVEQPTVGNAALDWWADPKYDPRSSFLRWKLAMGTSASLGERTLGGGTEPTAITPEMLTTWLVEYVVGQVTNGIGGLDVESAVVTVPHGWRKDTPEKLAATRSAAANASVDGAKLTVNNLTVSEPVAAASYWLWETRRRFPAAADEFVGKTVLAVDIGGGTVDLSLVRVGTPEQALVVVGATNNETAGDYATALVLARATALANAEHRAGFPTDPDALLALLADGSQDWIRPWFRSAQEMLHDASRHVARARAGRTPLAVRKDFEIEGGWSVRLHLETADLIDALEPFYTAGRELVAQFLSLQAATDLPHAVVFAGGGSRIAGVSDWIVRAALRGLVDEPDAVLGRVVMNDNQKDKAIALGAALVAAGEVLVEERLLADVGLEITLSPEVSAELGFEMTTTRVYLSPLIARSSRLPCVADSHELIGYLSMPAEASYDFTIVVFDDPGDPLVQVWTRPHPFGGTGRAPASVVLTVDTDGALTCEIKFATGEAHSLSGQTSRVRTGRTSLVFDAGLPERAALPIVSPNALNAAAARLRRGEATAPSRRPATTAARRKGSPA